MNSLKPQSQLLDISFSCNEHCSNLYRTYPLYHRKECEELEADERNIDSKIKKKQEELDRTEKRLRSLENVRPQFMDEVLRF